MSEHENLWAMRVYNSKGDLWDRIAGTEADLREQGVGFTTAPRQKTWHCVLFKSGARVAKCKAGVWRDL
jgi:hypothetical protein